MLPINFHLRLFTSLLSGSIFALSNNPYVLPWSCRRTSNMPRHSFWKTTISLSSLENSSGFHLARSQNHMHFCETCWENVFEYFDFLILFPISIFSYSNIIVISCYKRNRTVANLMRIFPLATKRKRF